MQFFVEGSSYTLAGMNFSTHLFGLDKGYIHLFGTDSTGKDIFSRTFHAINTSLAVGTIGVFIAFVLALIIGGIFLLNGSGASVSLGLVLLAVGFVLIIISALLSAAVLGLDALPMEGLDMKVLDEEFGLREKGFTSAIVVALGYHKDNDFNATLPKSRLDKDTIIERV